MSTYTHKMTPLPEQYDTAAIEKKWQQHWLNHKTYAWDANESRANSYVIDTPPPTVSGTLHMGHVFSYTQADFIARFQRMTGKNVFYPMGFDDNGLPTERLVEKTKKIRAVDMSREDFINVCLGVSEEARKEFRALFESIALSVDWAQEYHTISDDSRRLSQLSFLDLVQKGHCYRALRPFYWDPVDQTAIAQAEIVDKEMASHQNIILFEVDGAKVPVMTTRPELLPACVALMYHPDDAAKYKGKTARTPLFNIEVPMVADEKVDKEKGTGLVMCCTFGDDTDKEWWDKHKLQTRVILNKYGKLDPALLKAAGIADAQIELIQNKKTSNPDPKNLGARETIIALLKDAGLLTEQKPITHAVKCAERSGAPLEILPSEQWFVRVMDKKDALTAKAKECNWNPEWMRVRMEQWIEGLSQDWCISRQRYFGVPFPVWYELGVDDLEAFAQPIKLVYASSEQLPVNPLVDSPSGYQKISDAEAASRGHKVSGNFHGKIHINPEGKLVALFPDMDVMDTWATSSISPQLSAHAIGGDSDRFAKLFPADLRPQAHEIIRTWAFYTVVKAHLHSDSVPWHNLMISGWCLAEDKSKMSKSKGNVVTPVALIEEKGTDAVRYWAATSRLGQDTAFSPDLLKIGKKLVGKLWNATAFAAIHLNKMTDAPKTAATDKAITEVLDQWILSRLSETVTAATEAFARYEYADALDKTNAFFWADFCDNYLELIKKRVYNEDGSFTAAQQQSAIRALYYCLNTILKLYAPFVPHVTEELYSHIFADDYAAKGSLHARGTWPSKKDFSVKAEALDAGKQALEVLTSIRDAKSKANVSIKFPVKLLTVASAFKPDAWIGDVCGAGNVSEWKSGASTTVELAEQSDAA
ncbi:MAG: valine--tRNA ligase [Alphaproteobacteria bacterium]|nr:valine--tRNA ligase [Alphaproteobacteria bacterium]